MTKTYHNWSRVRAREGSRWFQLFLSSAKDDLSVIQEVVTVRKVFGHLQRSLISPGQTVHSCLVVKYLGTFRFRPWTDRFVCLLCINKYIGMTRMKIPDKLKTKCCDEKGDQREMFAVRKMYYKYGFNFVLIGALKYARR